MIWEEFKRAASELAVLGEQRFERTGVVMVGTLRKNGWPRISPVEPLFCDGHLYLGMMRPSRKATDLLRDSRCTVHSAVSNRDGSEGDFKVYGRAVEIRDLEMRRRYSEALYRKMGWKPEELEYHLSSVDIESVAFVAFGDGKQISRVWRRDEEGGVAGGG